MAKQATVEKVTESKDLILPEEINPVTLFGKDNKSLQPILDRVKKEVLSIVPDVTTAKGRKAITANVSRVTKTKTALDKVGKEHNAALKQELKDFDAQRKHAFTFLEEVQKEARKPLTDWENKEKERVEKCEGVINSFIKISEDADNWMNFTLEELNDSLKSVEGITVNKRLAEFEDEAEQAKNNAIKNINIAIQSRERYDNDQKELEELRAKQAEDDRKRYEADQKAQAERDAQAAIIKANDEKKLAEQREKAAKEQAAKDLAEAEKQKQIEVEAAAQAERDRIKAEKEAEAEAEKLRAANTRHKGKVNRAIVKEFLKCGITEKQAKEIVILIAKNKVPNVKISY